MLRAADEDTFARWSLRVLSEPTLKDVLEDGQSSSEGHELELRGEERGRVEVRAQILLAQLTVRFGRVPPRTRARVRAADEVTLARWALRVLSEPTLEEVLDDGAAQQGPATKPEMPDEIRQYFRTEGRAQTLLELLTARFGTVPARARARILAADEATLARWLLRFVTATTLKEVLDDGAGQRRPAAKAAGRRR